ncbi:DUF4123 domain-containing protein [Aliivibrio logei]|uniref:DUF4123 domain-containing protein n=1 Tax=Aliivibrio logei TaxID=688 RepID=UPI0035C90B99
MREQSYLIVNPLEDKDVIERFYHFGGNDAYPLYLDSEFDAQKEIGPWLLPYPSKDFLAYFAKKPSGFHIYFLDDIETHRQHWKSLTFAGLDGELVLFRYYDRMVLEPMLSAFSQIELSTFLGTANRIKIISNDISVSFKNSAPRLIHQLEPWWRIEKHHSQYSLKRHAWIVERLAWQRFPELMKTVYNLNFDIQLKLIGFLKQGISYQLSNEELEAYSMVQLAKNTQWEDQIVFDAWYMDDGQINMVKKAAKLAIGNALQQGSEI